ncbi:phosphoribosylanthranilate isomerase [Allorhodopirellula solitaria]|uniref:N-(5'-phosphoribosyl)anthranilate isomerase n=1 Tax=Allorhodopirellula solitaria TaxID=2527987 RepID=A0A5C5XQN8_9BACT|nr:phosphoribosylanthranilate isomerase [Allorhodopirellula solitaria]TWT65214.1 N-(5'-phosphoribosyl)anthranilate isomerase [Allorhodopirellula solitaria]
MIDFQIKICGIRSTDDVAACAAAGADCVGLNFYPPSVRYLDPRETKARAVNDQAAAAGLVRVGLFVNETADSIIDIAGLLNLDAVQLHGDETPQLAQSLLQSNIPVIRAIRLSVTPLTPGAIEQTIGDWADLPVTLLLDADAGAAYGGGGRQLDWPSLAAWNQARGGGGDSTRWILAGGLDCENVARARQTSTAARVDVASGVESSRGEKSAEMIQKFVAQCQARGVDESQ